MSHTLRLPLNSVITPFIIDNNTRIKSKGCYGILFILSFPLGTETLSLSQKMTQILLYLLAFLSHEIPNKAFIIVMKWLMLLSMLT